MSIAATGIHISQMGLLVAVYKAESQHLVGRVEARAIQVEDGGGGRWLGGREVR